MKTRHLFFLFSILIISSLLARDRVHLRLPDVDGYTILKCDFHSHTVFSDGNVWPDFRVGEAWIDGLDVLAITDHIEYQPHKDDVSTDHNRSFEIAKNAAASAGIILLKGSEITRDMPPGHFNAIFLKDSKALDTDDWFDAITAADDQGAFIFWNHPGWTGQESDGVGKWYDEHDKIFQAGLMHGIEVVNEDNYYPEVHQWCLDKKLTMLGNSDIHSTTDMQFNHDAPKHRPMTWVLAKDKSPESVREALNARRTIVYWRDNLIGEEQYLRPLFNASIVLETPSIKRRAREFVQISNPSDLVFDLELVDKPEGVSAPHSLTLNPGRTVRVGLGFDKEKKFDQVELKYKATNLWIAPNQGLPVSWTVNVE